MMDAHDTNLPLNQGELEEEKKTVEVSEAITETPTEEGTEKVTEEVTAEVQTEAAPKPATKEDVLNRLKELAQDSENANKQEIDNLKQSFYKLHNAELEAAKKQFIDNGGAAEDFTPKDDPTEEEFKRLMGSIKEKRSQLVAEQERQKEENLQVKLSIIEELKELVESGDDANKSYTEFKKLQQQWNETKLVPQGKVNELWKNYQLYVEKFYDLLKLNNEFREYDFKKNLEIKTHLCEAAEKLADEEDVVSAFHQLQKLHQEFRDTGPVAKELRDEIWNRFKAASTAVNRRHQQHFEALKESEQHNLDQKTVICEIVEAIEYDELKTFSAWENKTQEVIALQNKWKTIGFAPQKMNVKIFERFRHACDDFFKKKGEFFKALKEGMNENLEKKKALCEKAEALKDSTDWKATADALTKLQKEWKTIGPVAKKYSDAVWKRFITACDYFFDQKNKATSSQRSVEIENMEKKKALIEKLASIDENMDTDEASTLVRELMKEWNTIGHVPFKEKDKLYKQYHGLIDQLFDRFNISASNKKLSNFRSNISNIQGGGSQSLYREREKLVRIYENMKNELQTYENNLGFTKAVWNFCVKNQISMINASSAATYGAGNHGFDDKTDIGVLEPLNGYGYSKQLFDLWERQQTLRPAQYCGFKFFNVYGPNEYYKGSMASVIFHTFNKIKETGEMGLFKSYRPDYADGQQLRDFVYVKDICKVVKFMIEHPDVNGLFNLGTGTARSFYDLAKATFDALGLEPNIKFVEMPETLRKKYQYYTQANMEKLRAAGYHEAFYTLEEGCKDYVTNYLAQDYKTY